MAISSGARRALTEAVSWTAGGALLLAGVFYNSEIRSALGLRFEPEQIVTVPANMPRRQHAEEPETSIASSERRAGRDIVRLRADASGHYHTRAYVNGSSVDVLVDTGATTVALTWEDARAAGIRVSEADFTAQSRTANGIATFAPVLIDRLSIGEIELTRVQAHVARPRQLSTTLLGMSFLGKISVEMRDRELVLTQ